MERGEAVSTYQISNGDIVDGQGIVTVQQDVAFPHDGSEYVWLNIAGREVAVRWSSVDAYEID